LPPPKTLLTELRNPIFLFDNYYVCMIKITASYFAIAFARWRFIR
jgi:hypothetical protein